MSRNTAKDIGKALKLGGEAKNLVNDFCCHLQKKRKKTIFKAVIKKQGNGQSTGL